MFTGLIEATARVTDTSHGSIGLDLGIFRNGIDPGSSVAINGVCLTVAEKTSTLCRFDVSDETAKSSTLGDLRSNDVVNVERAMKASDRLGGHFVTGHVDGIGKIVEVSPTTLAINLPRTLMSGIVSKGSVTVDGISLTVATVTTSGFTAAIIPTTYENTNLNTKKIGSRANIETDILGKYVRKLIQPASGSITMEKLREHGF